MKVSVLLPNFNHGEYLARCIESYQAQTHTDWELAVVDDGSSDNSWEVICRYAASDARIRPHRFPANRGTNAAVQQALSMCTGELVYGAGADDYLCHPGFFSSGSELLARRPSAAGVFGHSRVVDAAGGTLWEMGAYDDTTGSYLAPEMVIADFFAGRIFIPGASLLLRRTLVTEYGGFDEALGPQADYYLNHALAMAYGVIYVREVFSVTQRSSGSFGNSADDPAFFRRHALVEKKWRSRLAAREVPHAGLRRWRANVVNGRLGLERQLRMIRLWDECFAGIQEWERPALMPEFAESEQFMKLRSERVRTELERRKNDANKLFDEIAGPLDPEIQPAPGRRSLTDRAWRALTRVARKVF